MTSYPSQAISGHLVLSELLTALMQVGGGNAEGQMGHLILPPPPFWTIDCPLREPLANQWHICASQQAEGEVVFFNMPVDSSQQLSAGIVHYVIDSKEPLVLDDATHNGDFTNDPYVLRTQAKSLLCMPLVNGGHLRGLLYLENKLTTGAFTADRVSVLNLLSAQAAISIENARWINTLEEKVASYTRQLKQEIIERKRAEEAAHAANQVKRAFLANMNHELRTPLHAILGYTQIFKREHPQDKRLETIERSGQHLLTLIEDVLDIAKASAGKIELYPELFHLPTFLNHLVEMTSLRAQAKKISFRYHTSGVMPAYVCADQKRLRQVLLNLLGNAVKFTEQGQVIFRLKTTAPLSRGGEGARGRGGEGAKGRGREGAREARGSCILRFEIEDTGCGIAPENIKHTFKPFEQVSESQKLVPGTGLGLAISHHLVALMGGVLEVKSQLGQGSTFSFEITLQEVSTFEKEPAQRQILHGYESVNNLAKSESQPSSLTIPPAQQLSELQEYTEIGDMIAIREKARQLSQQDQAFEPFANQLQQLAQAYQIPKIRQWLASLLDNGQ